MTPGQKQQAKGLWRDLLAGRLDSSSWFIAEKVGIPHWHMYEVIREVSDERAGYLRELVMVEHLPGVTYHQAAGRA